MQLSIKISVLDIDKEDGSIKYRIFLSNGITSSSMEFYGYDDCFKDFGNNLINFPATIDDDVILEIGEDNDRWAYYMLLKIFCYERNGHFAIKIVIDNHELLPDTNKVEYYIKTVPAALNTLGNLLYNWQPEIGKEITW